MSTFLFVNHASVGHLSTLLNLAVALRERGHGVRFAMPGAKGLPRWQIFSVAAAVPEMVRAEGMEVEVLAPTLGFLLGAARLPGKVGYAETTHAVRLLATGVEGFARQLVESLERERADVVVTDFGFPAAAVAADAVGVRYAVVFHSGLPFRGAEVPPFGSGLPIGPRTEAWEDFEKNEAALLAGMDGKVNGARRRWGLEAMAPEILRRPYSPWLNLIMSVPEMEAPRSNLTPETHFVGPCFGRGKMMAGDFAFEALREDRVKVYVSLGTVFNDKPEVFRVLMRGLREERYQVIVSAGASYDALEREGVPENVMLCRKVPQVALLPRVDLVIGHGGNNSTNETLAAGKPLLVLPVGGEQGDNARRVEWLGVGRRLNLENLREEGVREAARELLADAGVPERLGRIREAISRAGGIAEAARLVEGLAGGGG